MKRGLIRTKECELVAVWTPHQLLNALDRQVRVEDTDRSKYIRNAIREKIDRARCGQQVEVAA